MYKLNMFKSSFELPAKHENTADYQALWNHPEVVQDLHRTQRGRPMFLLHDGPPYANGHLHLGHFLNKSLKDAVVKFKRLDGYFAPFVPGFDCHGLPVELEVERQGHSKDDPVAFVRACRAYASSQVALQTAEFKDFGVSADWESAYLTMSPSFEAGAARLFQRLPQREKRLRPVHWCPACASSLAEAEVEHKTKSSDSLHVYFPLVPLPGDENPEVVHLLVWTTTPYTLPANRAVGFHPGLEYVEVAVQGKRVVRLREPADSQDAPVVSLAGRHAVSPWTQLPVPLLEADYVSSTGTGLVHLAPSFGLDDFRVCEAHGLAAEHFVDERGRFLLPELVGLSLAQAAESVLALLAERGLVHRLEKVEHEYPMCWRHKKPLFFKASEEWFMDLANVGPAAQRALEAVEFTPPAGRERLSSMLRSRTSWCMSRARLWGTPLAEDDGAQGLDQVEAQGVEAWHANGAARTLDVWFDSGVTHELVLRQRFGRAADLYLEGSDQHRGWFQSSLLTSVALHGKAPFAAVLTHGFVVDEQGRKYSKSSGNYVPLAQMFQSHSPDVLRLWALSQDCTRELRMSKETLARTVERYRKVRNTLRFCLQNTTDFDFSTETVPVSSLHTHLLSELNRLRDEMMGAARKHDFASAVTSLMQFCETTSADYFTAVKDMLYCEAPNAERRRHAQWTLGKLLGGLLRLLMPVLPYTTEEVFQLMKARMGFSQRCSLQLTLEDWAVPDACATFSADWQVLKKAVNRFVEEQRDGTLKSAAQLDLVVTLPVGRSSVPASDDAVDFFGCATLTWEWGEEFAVAPRRTLHLRCLRCRRHHPTVTTALCERCTAVEGAAQVVEGVAA